MHVFNQQEQDLLLKMFESDAWKLLTTYEQSRKDTVVRGVTVKGKSFDSISHEQGRLLEIEHFVSLPVELFSVPPAEEDDESDPNDPYSE